LGEIALSKKGTSTKRMWGEETCYLFSETKGPDKSPFSALPTRTRGCSVVLYRHRAVDE
jgi:hypothetical protein